MPVSASHSLVHFHSTVLQVVSDAWLYLVFQNPCPEILMYGSMSSLTRGSSEPHVLMHSEQAGKIVCAVSNLLKLGHNATRSTWLPGSERRGQKGARLSQVIGSVDFYAPLFALRIHFFIEEPLKSRLEWRCQWLLFYVLNLYFYLFKPSRSVRAHLSVQDPQVTSICVY